MVKKIKFFAVELNVLVGRLDPKSQQPDAVMEFYQNGLKTAKMVDKTILSGFSRNFPKIIQIFSTALISVFYMVSMFFLVNSISRSVTQLVLKNEIEQTLTDYSLIKVYQVCLMKKM